MALYHKWDVKKGFAYVLQFFSLISEEHFYFTRLNLQKVGPLQFCLLIFLGIHMNPKQKQLYNFCEGFLMAALTGPFWPILKNCQDGPFSPLHEI